MDPAEYNLTLSTPEYLEYYNWSFYEDFINRCETYYKAENLKKISFTLFIIIFILGIIGNGLVIWIAGFRMRKTVSGVWFLHLAIADFLCCTSIPLRIAQWVDHLYFSESTSNSLCLSNVVLFNLNMSASVLFLTAMSIDRWVSVMWPFWARTHRKHNLVRVAAGIIWGLSFILTIFVFFLSVMGVMHLKEWCVHFGCQFIFFQMINPSIPLIRFFIMFVVPFLIIVTSYVTIFLKLRSSSRPQRSHRPYRIITAVILCFFICWAPYYIWPLMSMNVIENFRFRTLDVLVTILAYLNSCINPIIYVLMGQDFRHSFLRSIPFRVEKAISEHPDNPNSDA